MAAIDEDIRKKAIELGYEHCGIVPLKDLEGYDEILAERVRQVPESAGFYENQKRFTRLSEQYPWAKSVVVAVQTLRRYDVPLQAEGHLGKHYLFDGRVVQASDEYHRSLEMGNYLKELGLETAAERLFGLVGLRWAAMKAGLGVVRKNNFFYTESGSWVTLEAWLTDRDMELIHNNTLQPCPEGCSRCIGACPSGSLSAPYTMSPVTCVSFLTTFGGRNLPAEPLAKKCRGWIYGCDACQDACPMNRNKWVGGEEFPGLNELAEHFEPEAILKLDDAFYREHIQPRFFYLKPEQLWKWKVNALNYMRNNYIEAYKPYIMTAEDDTHEKVREMAVHVNAELFGKMRIDKAPEA
jgi:epoxyqueuosine reductase